MSLFLLKPHVAGPEGNITTPDIVVDRVFVDGAAVPVSRVTHECWQQAESGASARAGYAIMALGGGALILPVLVLSAGPVVVARKAWRLNNLDGHVGSVTLNGTALADIELPAAVIEAGGGVEDALPRGYLLVKTAAEATDATLADPKLGRALTHRVILQPVDEDRWGDARPRPRYSVGPTQKDVQHFI